MQEEIFLRLNGRAAIVWILGSFGTSWSQFGTTTLIWYENFIAVS